MKKNTALTFILVFILGWSQAQMDEDHRTDHRLCQGVKIEKVENKIHFSQIQSTVERIRVIKEEEDNVLSAESYEETVFEAVSFPNGFSPEQVFKSAALNPGKYTAAIKYINQPKACKEIITITPEMALCDISCFYPIGPYPALDPSHFYPDVVKNLQSWDWASIALPACDDWNNCKFVTDSDEFSDGLKVDLSHHDLPNLLPQQMIRIEDGRIIFNVPNTVNNSNSVLPFRSELYYNQQVDMGTEQWIGWDFTFPDPYVLDNTEMLVFQLQQGTGFSPQISINIPGVGEPNAGNFIIRTHTGNNANNIDINSGVPVTGGGNFNFVVHIIYDEDPSQGVLEIWIDENKVDIPDNIATADCRAPYGGKLKWGVYQWHWNPNEIGFSNAIANMNSSNVVSHEVSMGPLRLITRSPNDENYGDSDFAYLVNTAPCPYDQTMDVPCAGTPCDDGNPLTTNDVMMTGGYCLGARHYESVIPRDSDNPSDRNDNAAQETFGTVETPEILSLGENYVGLRYTDIPDFSFDPSDENIRVVASAYIQFTSAGVPFPEADYMALNIQVALPGETDANTAPFSSANPISGRTLEPQTMMWEIVDPWGCISGNVNNDCNQPITSALNDCTGNDGPLQRTPDLADLLNELIFASKFKTGEDELIFVFTPFNNSWPHRRSVFSLGTNGYTQSDLSPRLVINYVDFEDPVIRPRKNVNSFDTAPVVFKIHPNPFRNQLILSLDANITEPIEVHLYGSNGQLLSSHEVNNSNSHTISVDGLSPGIYFVHVRFQDGKNSTKKVVKI